MCTVRFYDLMMQSISWLSTSFCHLWYGGEAGVESKGGTERAVRSLEPLRHVSSPHSTEQLFRPNRSVYISPSFLKSFLMSDFSVADRHRH